MAVACHLPRRAVGCARRRRDRAWGREEGDRRGRVAPFRFRHSSRGAFVLASRAEDNLTHTKKRWSSCLVGAAGVDAAAFCFRALRRWPCWFCGTPWGALTPNTRAGVWSCEAPIGDAGQRWKAGRELRVVRRGTVRGCAGAAAGLVRWRAGRLQARALVEGALHALAGLRLDHRGEPAPAPRARTRGRACARRRRECAASEAARGFGWLRRAWRWSRP